MSDRHPLDEWVDDAEKFKNDFKKQILKDTSLVFSVFSTEQGQRLLKRWIELLINSPTAHKGDDLLTVGLNEGNKSFIRTIIQAVKIHEESQ